jgi:hypothetical protein
MENRKERQKMRLPYVYEGEKCHIDVSWTVLNKSTVFREIIQKLEYQHDSDWSGYRECAEQLDGLVDRIYEHVSVLSSETMTSYDPTLPRHLEVPVNQINDMIDTLPVSGNGGVLFVLFHTVLTCLRETVAVYQEDNNLKNNERVKLKRIEKSCGRFVFLDEPGSEKIGYESAQMQLVEILSALDCLTDLQRNRLVKYYILRQSQQDIADDEGTTKMAISYSIRQALKKLEQCGFTGVNI